MPAASRSRSVALVVAVLTLIGLGGCGQVPPPESGEKKSETKQHAPAKKEVSTLTLTAMQEDNDVLTITTNFEEAGAVVLRVEGSRYEVASREGQAYTFRNVKVPKIGTNNAKLVVGAANEEVPFEIHRVMNSPDEYRKYAQPINYPQLSKAADRYAGTYVKGRGQVYQIQEEAGLLGGRTTWGGINVVNSGYGYFDGNIRFNMPGATDIVEGDIVNFYGKVRGSERYDTFAGGFLIAPFVEIKFMEK